MLEGTRPLFSREPGHWSKRRLIAGTTANHLLTLCNARNSTPCPQFLSHQTHLKARSRRLKWLNIFLRVSVRRDSLLLSVLWLTAARGHWMSCCWHSKENPNFNLSKDPSTNRSLPAGGGFPINASRSLKLRKFVDSTSAGAPPMIHFAHLRWASVNL